eukprot:1136814-Pelagomonas_calceolata.AAC.1
MVKCQVLGPGALAVELSTLPSCLCLQAGSKKSDKWEQGPLAQIKKKHAVLIMISQIITQFVNQVCPVAQLQPIRANEQFARHN